MTCATLLLCFFASTAHASLTNKPNENERQFGKEVSSISYSDSDRNFSGKRVYKLPFFGWQVEILYTGGRSVSEVARPKGNNFKKQIITESEANIIADFLYPKKYRGPYRKQIKNANFISHFFDNGVISYEMRLDSRRKNHVGVIGVRAIVYSDGAMFNSIMVNAYH